MSILVKNTAKITVDKILGKNNSNKSSIQTASNSRLNIDAAVFMPLDKNKFNAPSNSEILSVSTTISQSQDNPYRSALLKGLPTSNTLESAIDITGSTVGLSSNLRVSSSKRKISL